MTATPIHKPEWDVIPCAESRAFVEVFVTPEMAERWLNANYNNRPLAQAVIDHYARLLSEGQWKLNGETIKFDADLNLFDGQHRLYACLEANKGFYTDIRCGLDRDAFDTLDTGRKRTASDILHLAGERNTNVLSSAISWFWRIDKNAVSSSIRPSSVEIRKVLEANPGLRESVMEANKVRNLTSHSMASALYYLFSRKDKDKAALFFERLCDGIGLNDDSSIYLLRERLQANRISKSKLPMPEVCALFIKAWNIFRMERPMRALRWRKEEDFPAIQ